MKDTTVSLVDALTSHDPLSIALVIIILLLVSGGLGLLVKYTIVPFVKKTIGKSIKWKKAKEEALLVLMDRASGIDHEMTKGQAKARNKAAIKDAKKAHKRNEKAEMFKSKLDKYNK